MAIIECKYKYNDNCLYEDVPISAVSCQECLSDCQWQCTLYTGKDRKSLFESLFAGLEEKAPEYEVLRKTMEFYKNCIDDENDYSRICYEASLLYLYEKCADKLSEKETEEAKNVSEWRKEYTI